MAVRGCARSLADNPDLSVENLCCHDDNVSARIMPDDQRSVCRGELDALALRYAHHDEQLHAQFMPEDSLECILFDVFERERFEAIGCNRFLGVQINLDSRATPQELVDSRRRLSLTAPALSTIDALNMREAAQALCRGAFRRYSTSTKASPDTAEALALERVFDVHMRQLAELLDDQDRFAKKLLQILKRLSRHLADGHNDQPAVDEVVDHPLLADTEGDEEEDEESCEGIAEDETAQALDKDDSESQVESNEDMPDTEAQSQEGDALAEQLIDAAPESGRDAFIIAEGAVAAYKPFTTEFDEICHASELADGQTLQLRRNDLDTHIDQHSRLVRRLASRLQRLLLSRQRRHWQFDMEEGHLDTARLSRIVIQPNVPLSFKCESETPVRDTTITLLIDNSRSMLGRPMMLAAAATDIMTRTLERCGVSVEILGFTTAHLHGGRSTEQWELQGKPENPGRLNDLRHIVYKSADTPYRLARKHLGLMLDKDLLKQNIDGEALMWAYQRLMKRSEDRKILMVISDGAPVDTSTLGANAGDYLAAHLKSVIANIEGSHDVELLAIGIGHDVSRFYSHALSVFDARQLGPVMLNELDALFRKAA